MVEVVGCQSGWLDLPPVGCVHLFEEQPLVLFTGHDGRDRADSLVGDTFVPVRPIPALWDCHHDYFPAFRDGYSLHGRHDLGIKRRQRRMKFLQRFVGDLLTHDVAVWTDTEQHPTAVQVYHPT